MSDPAAEFVEPTDVELFLAFCKERNVEPTLKGDSTTLYVLPSSVIDISFFGIKIDPPEITVYFNDDGEWTGGTNWLWDNRLPWVRARRERFKQGR